MKITIELATYYDEKLAYENKIQSLKTELANSQAETNLANNELAEKNNQNELLNKENSSLKYQLELAIADTTKAIEIFDTFLKKNNDIRIEFQKDIKAWVKQNEAFNEAATQQINSLRIIQFNQRKISIGSSEYQIKR